MNRPDADGRDGGRDPEDGGRDAQEQDAGPPDSCEQAGEACERGEYCDTSGAEPTCREARCEDLDCGEREACRPVDGGGHACIDIGCERDLDCAPGEYCDGSVCRSDECEALERVCMDGVVSACGAFGGPGETLFECGSGGYFESACVMDAKGQGACGCEGDWDCPSHTTCEVGVCVGTGKAPTCTLPPADFADVPPTLELHWGADAPGGSAHDGTPEANPAPWATFTHVLGTPIVANLDDDNGDGKINELDFPEVLFMGHRGDNHQESGVLRAVHAGGPQKGADYFARCGDAVWHEGETLSRPCDGDGPAAGSPASPDGDSGAPVAVGDLNGDGVPEIVMPLENDRLQILDHRGELLYRMPVAWSPAATNETIAIANLDHAGYPELIVGQHVLVLGDDAAGGLTVTHLLTGSRSQGRNAALGTMACPADLVPARAGSEIVVGTTLYGMPASLATCATPPCRQALDVVWHAPDVAGQSSELNTSRGTHDGFCAVADVWGAALDAVPGPENPPDGKPEVVLIAGGHLVILEGATGKLITLRALGGDGGGAPNVDDFDGDGFMEIASALRDYYIVLDLQDPAPTHCPDWPEVLPEDDTGANPNPARAPGGACTGDADCEAGAVCGAAGACVCLHNGWKRGSDDDSSRATSSSVFDFNGDGSAEVVYNDECALRVYRGLDGTVLYSTDSRSRTTIENPVVADVDNDGNAEIVVGSNNAIRNRCDADGDSPTGVNGLRVFGDARDTWVSARRIWNQQSYHVTNVTEGGGIPLREADSWVELNGRSYNTYRSQPRSHGVAPDLTVMAASVSARGGGCDLTQSTEADVVFEVRNLGDLRVGPGVVVALEGVWDGGAITEPLRASDGSPLTHTLQSSLEPSGAVILSVEYDARSNSPGSLPEQVRIRVDDGDLERECDEANNEREFEVESDPKRPDLRLVIEDVSGCPDATVEAVLHNDGGADVNGTRIVWYAGDPAQGGERIGETEVTDSVPAGGSVSLTGTIRDFPNRDDVRVFGVVDPDRELDDCAPGNNQARAPETHGCPILIE